jgi:inner membrane transporter RhtA
VRVGSSRSTRAALALIAGFALLDQVPQTWSLAGLALVLAAGVGAERTGARPPPPRRGFPAGTTLPT